ncbi:MAG TPA: type II secretion system F family protein [Rhizomicrobium sp.]|nr:type II secretion system F family protein [Rhizomicrobium sp.]
MTAAFSLLAVSLCMATAAGLTLAFLQTRRRNANLTRLQGLLYRPDEMMPAAAIEARLPAFLARRLMRAGWQPRPAHVVLAVLALLLPAGAAAVAAGPLAGVSVGGALLAGGWFALEYRANAGAEKLSESMLGYLERVRQLLVVGNSLAVALQRATENSPPAVVRCLSPAMRRIANGGGVTESLEHCADDLAIRELRLLATATRINLQFGGSMTAILSNMIENVRAKASLERELRAGTAQIRASACVLGLLPMLVAAMVALTNRDYSRWFLVTHTGHVMIAYAVFSQGLGILCMRFIVRMQY